VPTPIGHSLGGLAVYLAARWPEKDWFLLGAVVVSALLPDLDFAITPFAGQSYHHYFTHSLGFTALFAGIAYLVMKRVGRKSPGRDAAIVTAAYLSHIILDVLTTDTTSPFGVQLLWPFSNAFFISPVTPFAAVWRGRVTIVFGAHNWMAAGIEVLILLPVVALFWWLRGGRSQSE